MNTHVKRKQPVGFTLEQINFLESLFPEVDMAGQSYGDLNYRAGQRSVLRAIKRGSNVHSRFYVISDPVPQ